MPQSLANILVHVIFSTKDRHPILTPNVAPKLHAYLAKLGISYDERYLWD